MHSGPDAVESTSDNLLPQGCFGNLPSVPKNRKWGGLLRSQNESANCKFHCRYRRKNHQQTAELNMQRFLGGVFGGRNEGTARSFSDRNLFVDVRSACLRQNCFFYQDLEGLTEVFGLIFVSEKFQIATVLSFQNRSAFGTLKVAQSALAKRSAQDQLRRVAICTFHSGHCSPCLKRNCMAGS